MTLRPHAGLVLALLLAGCGTAIPSPNAIPSDGLGDIAIECGPIEDAALCRSAVVVAATQKLNPPPITSATLRRPRSDDACSVRIHSCGLNDVIVTIQSGDTLQEVAVVPTQSSGWAPLELIR